MTGHNCLSSSSHLRTCLAAPKGKRISISVPLLPIFGTPVAIAHHREFFLMLKQYNPFKARSFDVLPWGQHSVPRSAPGSQTHGLRPLPLQCCLQLNSSCLSDWGTPWHLCTAAPQFGVPAELAISHALSQPSEFWHWRQSRTIGITGGDFENLANFFSGATECIRLLTL